MQAIRVLVKATVFLLGLLGEVLKKNEILHTTSCKYKALHHQTRDQTLDQRVKNLTKLAVAVHIEIHAHSTTSLLHPF